MKQRNRNVILIVRDDEARGLYCCFYFFLSIALYMVTFVYAILLIN